MLESMGGANALWTMPAAQWMAAPMDASRAVFQARLGHRDDALEVLVRSIRALQLAPPGAPNFPIFSAFAAHILWSLERPQHLTTVEEVVHTKVLQPDLRYPESDARWSIAQLPP